MDINQLIKAGDVDGITAFCKTHGLIIRDGMIVPQDEVSTVKAKALVGFWDQRQQARKILLNSLYGALLNEALRFSDERMGQSVTLTGRSIARHMNAKINEIITGDYDHMGEGICYADTDSSYFSAAHLLRDDATRDDIITLYDGIADAANESFPDFMNQTFNTGRKRGSIIQAGRELIASKALFIKKKKYACLIYDLEGTRLDVGNKPGKLKAMGLDLKRADTPKFMQSFLETVLMDVLQGSEEKEILPQIAKFRTSFKTRPSWEKGSPKKVQNLTKYLALKTQMEKAILFDRKGARKEKKSMIPGHVLASINWNTLLDIYNDKYSMRVTDGSRIIVCKLKPNHLNMTSVAYPVDEPHLPKWFLELPFDDVAMETTIIDKKIDNLLGVLSWNLKATHANDVDDLIVF